MEHPSQGLENGKLARGLDMGKRHTMILMINRSNFYGRLLVGFALLCIIWEAEDYCMCE